MRETLHWLEPQQKGSRAIGPKETPGVAITCQYRRLVPPTSGPERPPPTTSLPRSSEKRAALSGIRSLPGEGAAGPPRSGQTTGGRTRTPPRRPFFGERKKRKDCSHGPSRTGGGWRGPHRCRPDTGLARTYRSGSGSPPQCCGRRTRTKAPPSSRQGTRRVSLTLRTIGVSVSGPEGGHTSGSNSVERA